VNTPADSLTTAKTARPASAGSTIPEFTLRAVILGGLITLVFTAANVYLGLKVGLTFATSIPAAVISMALLRRFANHTIQENNIVQTIASAAGTLSAIIFVLPGLVMIGWWSGFPYWTTAFLCAIGGILGVMYSIPLRRALVTGSDLPYPEGVAAAEVLKVGNEQGSDDDNKRGLHVIIAGSIASAAAGLLAALKATTSSVAATFRIGSGGTMIGGSLSLALLGVGHLVGVSVGIAMLIGLVISYGILLPIKTAGLLPAEGDISETVSTVFADDVRFIGAGAMAVAAVWTLIKIIGPIVRGIKESLASSRKRHDGEAVDVTERDIPFATVAGVTLASMIPVGILLWLFVKDSEITHHMTGLISISIVYVLAVGLIVAGICGYMAGLIGASNSPVSGVGIIVVISAALLIKLVTGNESDANPTALVAYTLFTAAVVFGVATIANDNLQDLKTGQLVGATPWKQQLALIFGVVFGAAVIPPVLQLMLTGFGFAGMEGAGPDALAAPQAALMSSVANGIFGNSLDWSLIGLGAVIGVVIIIVNEILVAKTKASRVALSLPPLAVGMGMYLPISVTLIVPIGAFLGLAYNRWCDRKAAQATGSEDSEETTEKAGRMRRLGVLMATGLIVGESLFGVVNAGIIAASGNGDALAVFPDGWEAIAPWAGLLVTVALIAGMYSWVRKLAAQESH